MTFGARPTLIAVHSGWLPAGAGLSWPNAMSKPNIAGTSALAPAADDGQNRRLAPASNRLTRISAVAITQPLAKSP